jgi:hypothetical protein
VEASQVNALWLLVLVPVVFSAGFVAGSAWGALHAYRDGYRDAWRLRGGSTS